MRIILTRTGPHRDKPLSLIESLMSRKANEPSEISQVYLRAG